jgi:hypothetical protein
MLRVLDLFLSSGLLGRANPEGPKELMSLFTHLKNKTVPVSEMLFSSSYLELLTMDKVHKSSDYDHISA